MYLCYATLLCIISIQSFLSPQVRCSQPFFLYLILIGTLIMSFTIVTLTFDSDQHSIQTCSLACHLDIWFLTVGFTAVFAALFSKAWRINIIMEQSMKLKRVLVRIRDVMLPFVALLLANVIVLVTWTIHDPLAYKREAHPGTDDWNRDFSFYGKCHSEHATIYFSVLIVMEAISLVLAMYQTYKTRNYRTEFNESAYIGVTVVCICKCILLSCKYTVIIMVPLNHRSFTFSRYTFSRLQFKDLLWGCRSLYSQEIKGGR